jgi:hypothetical protein
LSVYHLLPWLETVWLINALYFALFFRFIYMKKKLNYMKIPVSGYLSMYVKKSKFFEISKFRRKQQKNSEKTFRDFSLTL